MAAFWAATPDEFFVEVVRTARPLSGRISVLEVIMFNLSEYRNKPHNLADFLPWAAARRRGHRPQQGRQLSAHRALLGTRPRKRHARRAGRCEGKMTPRDRASTRTKPLPRPSHDRITSDNANSEK
jgi:hypothetical protein